MGIKNRLIFTLTLILLSVGATAQLRLSALQFVSSPENIEQLRQENEKLKQEKEIRELVKTEVNREIDRNFSWTINLINVLLFALTLLPVGASLFLMFLRSSIEKKIIDETVQRVKKEVETEFYESGWLDKLADEIRQKRVQIQLNTEREKSELIDKLNELIPSFVEIASGIPLTFEKQQELTEITSQLKVIRQVNPELLFTPDEYLKQGEALFLAEKYEEAIERFDKVINLQNDNYSAWFNKGWALKRLSRYEEAVTFYDQGLKFNNNNYLAWFGRGNALKKLERYKDAIFSYNKALKIYAEYDWAWYRKACCLALQNEVDLALESLSKAININRSKFLELAKSEPDFAEMKDLEEFQDLVYG